MPQIIMHHDLGVDDKVEFIEIQSTLVRASDRAWTLSRRFLFLADLLGFGVFQRLLEQPAVVLARSTRIGSEMAAGAADAEGAA